MKDFKTLPFKYVTLLSVSTVVIGAVALWVGFALVGPIPPRMVVMTTGPEGKAYHEFGERYQQILARAGIELQLRPSHGAVENLERLRDPQSGVTVGFLQAGLTNAQESPNLISLGTLFYEPLWVFYRGKKPFASGEDIGKRRFSIGPQGSGTRALALRLLALNGISEDMVQLLALPPKEAAEALLKGQIEIAILVASWDSPIVQQLLESEDVSIYSLPNADAYVALLPFLNRLVVPANAGNMEKERPPSEVVLSRRRQASSPKRICIQPSNICSWMPPIRSIRDREFSKSPGSFRLRNQLTCP